MKLSFFAIALACVSACASHNSTPTQPPVPKDQSYYNPPPSADDLVLKDKAIAERQAVLDEEKAYWQSLENITTKIRAEALNLSICKEAAKDDKSVDCNVFLKHNCEVDELVDSRGGHHDKPYCQKQ